MDLAQLRGALNGVLAFAPTFFRTGGELDLDALARHVDRLADSGVCGVVVAGGVGEFYALDDGELRDLVAVAVDAASGRTPVLAGVGHATDRAAQQARLAAGAGAAGLMVNPFYFIRPEPAGIIEHCRRLGEASGLGLMMFSTRDAAYDVPALQALSEVDAVVAVKDEFGDLDLFAECVRELGDRYVWINGMAEIPAVEYAARGAVVMTSGIVNLDPALALRIWDAAERGDADTHRRLMAERVAPIAALRTARPGYHITVIKEALSLLGTGTATVRPPLVPLRPDERAMLREHLTRTGFPDRASA
ncbi:5-dehydro-4-deoxyglucarate dehydratase [Dactylosporangium fulvum]|uniref:Dihydrodipicolinate synthase family protein n=1 Tax=Dactylosporangium fulvum TaxID=53359 RepID=A0ABY5W8A6_9ACTN|nr:dihydrodipicolinate synthase family protein [Dactylosporangium fulvum]UWP85306.1 dihydrodipicolinate synthase family protein [Dactylosporangium fulvum]